MSNVLAIHDFPFQIAYDAWHTWGHNYSNFSNYFRGMKSTFLFANVSTFSIVIFELFHCAKKYMFKIYLTCLILLCAFKTPLGF
jgi:hypothetical protein